MIARLLLGPFALAAMLMADGTAAVQCTAESGARRVPLLELYTSEGCDSCPPADRWLSALPERGLSPDRLVALAFHVDYWNYLGWTDPFASADYSERQQVASRRNRARAVYTPQLLLNGRDYRRGVLHDDFAERVSALSEPAAGARIRLKLAAATAGALPVEGSAVVLEAARRSAARAYVALYENNLSTPVTAGENRGKRLRHDFVVRELAGPYAVDSRGIAAFSHAFRIGPGWKTADLRVAAFVQDEISGDVLQALALPHCD